MLGAPSNSGTRGGSNDSDDVDLAHWIRQQKSKLKKVSNPLDHPLIARLCDFMEADKGERGVHREFPSSDSPVLSIKTCKEAVAKWQRERILNNESYYYRSYDKVPVDIATASVCRRFFRSHHSGLGVSYTPELSPQYSALLGELQKEANAVSQGRNPTIVSIIFRCLVGILLTDEARFESLRVSLPPKDSIAAVLRETLQAGDGDGNDGIVDELIEQVQFLRDKSEAELLGVTLSSKESWRKMRSLSARETSLEDDLKKNRQKRRRFNWSDIEQQVHSTMSD